jgi:hypothetical protein
MMKNNGGLKDMVKEEKNEKKNGGYEVKNVKSFKGHDGLGFNASLYRDGTKVAFVTDLASGGDIDFNWEDSKAKIRYCVEGCGAHTKEPMEPVIPEGTDVDITDSMVCPWCAEEEFGGMELSKAFTGKDGTDRWVKKEA